MIIDHIGIAVTSIEDQIPLYARLIKHPVGQVEELPHLGVRVAFVVIGEQKLELIEPLSDQSPISKFLEKRGPGMHHIAYRVEDIYGEMERLGELGFRLLQTEPHIGAGGKLVCFLHPKSTNGVLTELVQTPKSYEEE